MSEDPTSFRSRATSTENSQNYNVTWKQNGYIISPMSEISTESWPFKMKGETEEEFRDRIQKLKDGWNK